MSDQKMSYAEIGIISLSKRLQIIKDKKEQRIELYNSHPNTCRECNNILPYEKRHSKYCNTSCSVTANNRGKAHNINGINCSNCDPETRYKYTHCSYCGNPLPHNRRWVINKNTFCCRSHQKLYHTEELLKLNKPIYSTTLKFYLVQTRGYKCQECGLTEWRGKQIPLESHHIDGDVTNNHNENLKLLCKNCHGLTDNYGVKNYGNSKRYKPQRAHSSVR